MGDNAQPRVGMYPSATQIEAEKKTRLRPLQAAVKAHADLSSDAVVEIVKKAMAYRPMTEADICRYTGLTEEEVHRRWGDLMDRPD